MTKPKEQTKAIVRVQEQLVQITSRVAEVLPKTMDVDRFMRVARLLLARTPDLLDPRKVEPLSVLSAVMDAARLGLEIGREAHLVKFGRECVLLPDYRGYQKLALETGALRVIEARVVYQGDEFLYQEGTQPKIDHVPQLSCSRANSDVVAFYVVAFFKDLETCTFLVRTPEQIEHIRAKSRAKDNGPWVTDWQAMGLKTVIKEICDKRLLMLPNAEKLSAAIEIDNRAETGEIGRPLESDTDESLARTVAARTAEKLDNLKNELGVTNGNGKNGAEQPSEQTETEAAEDKAIVAADAERESEMKETAAK